MPGRSLWALLARVLPGQVEALVLLAFRKRPMRSDAAGQCFAAGCAVLVSRAIGWRACWTRHCEVWSLRPEHIRDIAVYQQAEQLGIRLPPLTLRSVNAGAVKLRLSTLTALDISMAGGDVLMAGMTMVAPPPGVVSTVAACVGHHAGVF